MPTIYDTYTQCPKCSCSKTKVFKIHHKVHEKMNYTKPIEEWTVTYKRVYYYSCPSCKHEWEEPGHV